MKRSHLAAVLFSTFAMSAAPVQQPAAPALFLDAPHDAYAPVKPDATFAAERLVAVRTELFADAKIDFVHPLVLSLELESGAGELASFEQRETLASGGVGLIGRLQNTAQSQVIFLLRGDRVTGTVRDGARSYKLGWA